MSLKRLQQQFESQVVGGKSNLGGSTTTEPQEHFAPIGTFNEPRPYAIIEGDNGLEACEVMSQTNIAGFSPALWLRSDDDGSMAPVSVTKPGLETYSNQAAARQALQSKIRQSQARDSRRG